MNNLLTSVVRKPISDKPYVSDGDLLSSKKIKLVDLFAGIGGFHYGIAASAAKVGKGVEPILVSEINEICQDVYKENHNPKEIEGDINKIDLSQVSKTADVVTAGFPCQPFSNSGLKLGLSDPRGQFYFKIEEIIRKYNSKSFILENVPGIKTNGGHLQMSLLGVVNQHIGKSMQILEEHLLNLKEFHVKWIEIDSSHLGSPQVRKRIYVVGIRKDFTKNLEFEEWSYKPKRFIDIAERRKIPSLELSKNQEENIRRGMKESPPSFRHEMRRVGKAYSCDGGNVGQGYHAYGMVPTLTKVWSRFLPIYFPHERERNNLPKIGEREYVPNRAYGDGYIRRASVKEVMKLQGFPLSFIPNDKDRLAYEQAGNAVNAKVVREIMDNLMRYLS